MINSTVSGNQNGEGHQEADVVSVIDYRHIIPVRQQRLAPQYPEESVGEQCGNHGDPRLPQSFQAADVYLVQGIEEIEGEGPIYGRKGVCLGRRVPCEKGD